MWLSLEGLWPGGRRRPVSPVRRPQSSGAARAALEGERVEIEGEDDPERVGIVNRNELALLLGVSAPKVNVMVRDGMPVLARGKSGQAYQFDFEACEVWRDEEIAKFEAAQRARHDRVQAALDLRGGRDSLEGVSLADRKAYLEAERLRMALAVQRGEYVPKEQVLADYEALFALIAESLQALPDRLERRCALEPHAVSEMIAAIDELQGELVERAKALEAPAPAALDEAAPVEPELGLERVA